MKKILVIFTGGTIGSMTNGKEIDVEESRAFFLIDKFYQNSGEQVEFETMRPLNILSENSAGKSLTILVNELLKIDYSKYDGIIITHGSDTLPYTSALVGFLLAGIDIPVVLVASNYELTNPLSNGIRNFTAAVEFICHEKLAGVFVVFENKKGEMRLYLATRLVEAKAFDDQFSGYGEKDLGEIKNGKLVENSNSLDYYRRKSREISMVKYGNVTLNNNIFFIRPFPGLNYEYLDFGSKKPRAILHGLYHSSTACSVNTGEGGLTSLAEFIRKCTKQGIDVYLAPFRNINDELYASSNIILQSGGIPLSHITIEAALMKLMLAYNLGIKDVREFMRKEIYFEFNNEI